MGKRKRGGGGGQQLVKCDNRSNVEGASYEKIFCLCIDAGDCGDQGTEWYRLYMSSDKDSRKEEDEKKALIEIIPNAELRGSYLAFHHDERHWGGGDQPPLPLITQKQNTLSGTCCTVVGSTIYRFGGRRANSKLCSRKLIYFDTNCPEDGWKRGPPTICGRKDSAVVALHGTIYVFGGCKRDGGVWAEYFDTTTLLGKGEEVEWCPLLYDRPPPLGIYDYLFAAVIDDDGGGKYSGMILVGSIKRGVICLFDVTDEVWWKTLNLYDVEYGMFSSNPTVVGTTMYWVQFDSKNLCAYDLVHRTYLSTPVGDFEICQQLKYLKYSGVLGLQHLAGDVFCMIWTDDKVVHCTNFRFCTTDVIDASVLCCHSYDFDHDVSLLDCLLMETPSLLVDC